MKNRRSIKNSPRAVREPTSRKNRETWGTPGCYSADIKCRCAFSRARCRPPATPAGNLSHRSWPTSQVREVEQLPVCFDSTFETGCGYTCGGDEGHPPQKWASPLKDEKREKPLSYYKHALWRTTSPLRLQNRERRRSDSVEFNPFLSG